VTAIDPSRMQAALDLSELPGLLATQDRQDFFGILEICIDRYEQERSIVDHAGDPDEREPPFSDAWDPRRAIVQWDRAGEKEEATWLAFLTTYFGYRDDGDRWQAVRTVYAGFGEGRLSWETVRTNRRALDVCVRHAEEYKTLAFGTFRNLEPSQRLSGGRRVVPEGSGAARSRQSGRDALAVVHRPAPQVPPHGPGAA
jgi:alpha-glutamyl/putrescinyl thymine pyrophosphorylase-like protein